MATSSMHKPGWRSRRRSRLSLVERAVPRLGRLGTHEDDAKTTPASSKSAPPKHAFQGRSKKTDGVKVEPKAVIQAPGSDASMDNTAPDLADMPEEAPASDVDLATDRTDDIGGTILSEIDDEPARDDGQFEMPAATADLVTPSSEADRHPEVLDAELEDERPDAPLPSPSPAAALPATMEKATIGEPGTSTGPMLELDWDRLIELGYTDPRDRGRPLPRKMDEIIRALIRQALSDQSSWRDRVILVTSPHERASKSAAAINFAFGLTTVSNHRAVLVDVDTTGSGAVDHLGGKNFAGLTAALADESVAIDALEIKTDLDRLTLVASGDPDDETLDRFASHRMLHILRHLTEDPDTLLVIDAPPILASQEAAVLSVVAGQVVLAVEAGITTADQIDHALQRIGERHNVSLVLNESAGLAREDTLSADADMATATRRAPSIKRRQTKPGMVAAGAVALSLFMAQPVEQAVMDGAVTTSISAISAKGSASPERWSNHMATVPFRQVDR